MNIMTKKKELVWRLATKPTAHEVTELLSNGIISKEEAKEILFNQKENDSRDIKSLESEIKFLRDLVEKLSKNNNQITTIIKEIQPHYVQHGWYRPYEVWCGTSGSVITQAIDNGTITANGTGEMYLTTNSAFNAINTF